MNSVFDIITDTRELTIKCHYNSACEQIRCMVEKNPFETTFIITSGCISKDITHEIARRINHQDHGTVKAIVKTDYSIIINCPLMTDN